jgi:tRNA (cytidine32/uridine32-2'-O)-methyltransferase
MLSRCELCLVGTANPENLGAVARLVENFAVPGLTLVAPRAAPDDHRALVVGRMARERLAAARIAPTLEAAVADCVYVVGFSARRGGDRPLVGLRALASLVAARAPAGPVALVFGPEDTGLVAADIARCDVVVAIETPGPLPSLNLAQAVALACWELASAAAPPASARGGATRAALEALVDHAMAALDAVHYVGGHDRERQRVHLRRVLAAAALGSDEVRALHGICAQVLRAVAGGG